MRLQHFSHEDPMSNGRTFNYNAFGFNTMLELLRGQNPNPVANLIGGFTNPGVPMNNTPTYGPNAPLDYTNAQKDRVVVAGGGPGTGDPFVPRDTNTNTNTFTNPTPTTPTNGGGGINLDSILRGQREIADRLYGQARGYYDEGMRTLGDKRKQFETLFNEGKTDILQGFEKGAGELQSSAQGAKERNAQALRALGLGGSAVVRSQGRERQNEAKALASLQDTRSTNERGNRDAYQGNTDWANAQESSLSRGLENAGIQRQIAGQQQVESVANLFNNIISNQMAAAAAAGQYTANPYQVNIPDQTNALAGILSSAGILNGGTTGNEGVNIDPNDALLTSLYGKKRTGVSGRGLYV